LRKPVKNTDTRPQRIAEPPVAPSPVIDPPTEMSMRRTGMSFQRTRMSADAP